MKNFEFARFALLLLVLLVVAPGVAFGQEQSGGNPVMVHYRAYNAAMERGDLSAAETSAAAALDASISRDGDGGNTAVLAINLAQTRLSMGRADDAYEPAMRAHSIASGGGSNVDPLLAELVLGRAELTDSRWRQGRDRLTAVLPQARARPEFSAETYSASADLGRRLFSEEQFSGAMLAWEIAKDMADAAGDGNDYARAEARMGHAAATFVQAMAATIDAQARPTDTRLNRNANAAFEIADDELLEAQTILGPFAYTPAEDGGLTLGQRVYASAVAWRTLMRAFADSRGIRTLASRGAEFSVPSDDPRPVCRVSAVIDPQPDFPPGASTAFAAGAVVVRIRVGEGGEVLDSQVAAAIPERWFRDAVERVAPQWRVQLDEDSPPDCRYPPIDFLSIKFYFR